MQVPFTIIALKLDFWTILPKAWEPMDLLWVWCLMCGVTSCPMSKAAAPQPAPHLLFGRHRPPLFFNFWGLCVRLSIGFVGLLCRLLRCCLSVFRVQYCFCLFSLGKLNCYLLVITWLNLLIFKLVGEFNLLSLALQVPEGIVLFLF